jgi:uncharacterized OsmC-like protein
MATARIEYLGDLQTRCTHLKSGVQFVTDAPVDNNGKGSAFSPTDLLATAYVSCMLTIVGIYCQTNGLNFQHGVGEVNKIMASGPRRVAQLEITLDLRGNDWTDDEQRRVQQAAENCPVAKSVDPAMEINFTFQF